MGKKTIRATIELFGGPQDGAVHELPQVMPVYRVPGQSLHGMIVYQYTRTQYSRFNPEVGKLVFRYDYTGVE